MGNCIETICLPRSHQQPQAAPELHEMDTASTTSYPQKQSRHGSSGDEEEEVLADEGKVNKEVSETGKMGDAVGGGGSVRVKIVLTKEELHWLMTQLKSDGENRLENMLEHLKKGRNQVVSNGTGGKKFVGWKPSLESIMETPELLEMKL